MKTHTFKVVVEAGEDRWYAYCPALESLGGATWGLRGMTSRSPKSRASLSRYLKSRE